MSHRRKQGAAPITSHFRFALHGEVDNLPDTPFIQDLTPADFLASYPTGSETSQNPNAITNQRLLMALGPDRGQIREVALTDLASVYVHYRRRYGYNALNFTKRGQSTRMSVWAFVDSGKPDKWDSPWIPEDPLSVRQMIEDARVKLYPLFAHGTGQNGS